MRNPLQTTVTHAEPVFDSFGRALGRALGAIAFALDASGMAPLGKARATYTSPSTSGHAFPLVVVSCVAAGPDLPDPEPEVVEDNGRCGECRLGLGVHNYADPLCEARPDLEADGYGWPEAARVAFGQLAEPPC